MAYHITHEVGNQGIAIGSANKHGFLCVLCEFGSSILQKPLTSLVFGPSREVNKSKIAVNACKDTTYTTCSMLILGVVV